MQPDDQVKVQRSRPYRKPKPDVVWRSSVFGFLRKADARISSRIKVLLKVNILLSEMQRFTVIH